jgi:hypothetical protein
MFGSLTTNPFQQVDIQINDLYVHWRVSGCVLFHSKFYNVYFSINSFTLE